MEKIQRRFGAHVVSITLGDNDPVEENFSDKQKLDRFLSCFKKAIESGEFKRSWEQSKY